MTRHWLTHYDPDDGAPYAEKCECGLGEDHNAAEFKAYLDEVERETALQMERDLRERLEKDKVRVVADDALGDWITPCVRCGHPMHNHILDLELDPEIDCTVPACKCTGFKPGGTEDHGGPVQP